MNLNESSELSGTKVENVNELRSENELTFPATIKSFEIKAKIF